MNYSDISFPNQRGEMLINTLSDSGWVHSDKKQMLWEIQLLKERNALRMGTKKADLSLATLKGRKTKSRM